MNQHSELHPHEAQRVLSGGRPGGPEQDALWSRLDADLTAVEQQDARAQRGRWRQRLLWLLPVAALPAAIAFAVFPSAESQIAARGASAAASTFVVATCGSPSAPCKVGEKIYFSLHGVDEPTTVEGRLEGTSSILFRERLKPMEARAATVALTPEFADVTSGLTIEIDANGNKQRLHLEVRP